MGAKFKKYIIMEKQFVTYEIALSLKELGFNEPCLGFFDKELFLFCLVDQESDCEINTITYKNGLNNIIADINYETIIIAPLWQQVIDWFRDKHNTNIEPIRFPNILKWGFVVTDMTIIPKQQTLRENINMSLKVTDVRRFDTFEESREQAILKAIELCKKQ